MNVGSLKLTSCAAESSSPVMQTVKEPSDIYQVGTVQAIIITNCPETLRSTVLQECHLNQSWFDSSICLGIPKSLTREILEGEIFLAGLPKPSANLYDSMSLSEVGCTYAHLKALSIAAKRNCPTLILEDDADFDPKNLQQVLANLDWLPDDAVVKLEGDDKPGGRIVFGLRNRDSDFMISNRPSRGSAGYLVTPKSAEMLVKAAHGYPLQYDIFLNDSYHHGCLLLDAVPFPIRQAGQTSSTITRGLRRKGIGSRFARQWSKLRARIRRITAQLRSAIAHGFTRVSYAKFYEND